jgi:cytolysin (calcineurin-like family phosphatase)
MYADDEYYEISNQTCQILCAVLENNHKIHYPIYRQLANLYRTNSPTVKFIADAEELHLLDNLLNKLKDDVYYTVAESVATVEKGLDDFSCATDNLYISNLTQNINIDIVSILNKKEEYDIFEDQEMWESTADNKKDNKIVDDQGSKYLSELFNLPSASK